MPWKTLGTEQQRWLLVRARLRAKESWADLSTRFGVSPQCAQKWWRRFCKEGRSGLRDRTRRPDCAAELARRWKRRVGQARRRNPTWGAAKLAWWLRRRYRQRPLPSARTICAWLSAAGATRPHVRHARNGPVLISPRRLVAQRPNDVWTVDFKGWFRTADRKRVGPLTVRDATSRYVLEARHVRPRDAEVDAAMCRLFREYGLPRAIQVDNGPPFGSCGPRGWTTLSLKWVKLGIVVQYGRPGCPQDNAAHEQTHAVLQREVAEPPAATFCAQQQRLSWWRRRYNQQRPHESLGMRPPAQLYRRSQRKLQPCRPPSYPSGLEPVQLDSRGRLFWRGLQRLIGKAFIRETVGLKQIDPQVCEVYFATHLLGTLHAQDKTGLRPVLWRRSGSRKGEGATPPPSTLPTNVRPS